MYRVTVTFRIKRAAWKEATDKAWHLAGAWLHAGQMRWGEIVSCNPRQHTITVTGTVPERTSLSTRNASAHGRKSWSAMRRLWSTKPHFDYERLLEPRRTCRCKRRRTAICSPLPFEEVSPLQCAKCRGRIPLYRLRCRTSKPDPFFQLHHLDAQWKGAHHMWIDSGELESLGWRLLADPESKLTQYARRVIRELEELTGLTIYYELFSNYGRDDGIEARICPGCGRPWDASGKTYKLACHRCRLASYTPVDTWLPRWWRPLRRHRMRARERAESEV